ncbi:hypothetical protein YC2023_019272 [Brassica napus]
MVYLETLCMRPKLFLSRKYLFQFGLFESDQVDVGWNGQLQDYYDGEEWRKTARSGGEK